MSNPADLLFQAESQVELKRLRKAIETLNSILCPTPGHGEITGANYLKLCQDVGCTNAFAALVDFDRRIMTIWPCSLQGKGLCVDFPMPNVGPHDPITSAAIPRSCYEGERKPE